MKYLNTFLLVLCSLISYSQDIEDNGSVPTLTEIVKVEGVSKEELYNRAKVWFVRNFKSAKNVIQLDDKVAGKIIGKGNIPYDAPAFNPGTNFSGYFELMLTVELKDGRFRYSIEDLQHVANKSGCSGGALINEKASGNRFLGTAPSKKGWKKIQKTGNSDAQALIYTLVEAMKKPSQSDDW